MRSVKIRWNTGPHAPDSEATDPGEKNQALPREQGMLGGPRDWLCPPAGPRLKV